MRSRGKNILFVAPTNELKAGGEISHLELIKTAKKRGYKVHVVLPARGALDRQLKSLSISTYFAKYEYWEVPPSNKLEPTHLLSIDSICHYILQNEIDCVITNTLNIPWGALAAAFTDRPHIWIAREFPKLEFSYLVDRYEFINNYSNTVIANSKRLAEYMRNNLKIKKTKYFFSYVETKNLQLQRTAQPTKLVHIGSILPRKNQIETIKMLHYLKENYGFKPKLVFIGQYNIHDDYYQALIKEIKKYTLQKQVVFKNHTSSPFSKVSSNDIIIQPSKSESIGRVVTEAMKLGLIVVGSDIDGNKEAFKLGGGTIYKLGDIQNFGNTIANILNRQKYYKKRALIAQKRALKNMSETKCHNEFFIELNNVIGQPNPQGSLQYIYPFLNISSSI